MSKHLERDLERMEREVLAQSSRVEEMIAKASRALVDRQSTIADELMVIEEVVNEREVQIEEECLKILALHQPVAVDLRRISSALKINSDLERIADLAVNIARYTASLNDYPEFEVPSKLEWMSTAAAEMVHSALDAFVKLDSSAALAVCQRDDEVDDCNREVIEELIQVMQTRSELIQAALYFFSISRHIERIADYATNIAEDVIYLVEGEIARHQFEESSPD